MSHAEVMLMAEQTAAEIGSRIAMAEALDAAFAPARFGAR